MSASGRFMPFTNGRYGSIAAIRDWLLPTLLLPSSPTIQAGLPAMQALRWMAPAVPVFAGKPAPTKIAVRLTGTNGAIAAGRG